MRYGDEGLAVQEWFVGLCATDPVLQDLMLGGTAPGVPAEDLMRDRLIADAVPVSYDQFPIIIFSTGEGQDWNPVGSGGRVFTVVPLTVKVTGKGASYLPLAPIARRLYDLVVGNHNTVLGNGGLLLTGRRDSTIQYPDQANGVQYRHLGGLFQIITQ